MKQKVKSIFYKLLTLLAGSTVAMTLFSVPALADGGAYLSDTYLEIAEGDTATIAVSLDNAVGTYSVSADGCVSAGGSGWLENESASISIYGASVGTGTVSVTFGDLATYDDEDLSGTTLYVEVEVYKPEGGYSGGDKGKEGGNDDGQEAGEPQTEEQEPEMKEQEREDAKRIVTLNKKEHLILNSLKGVKIPKGFEEKKATYNGEKIKVLSYADELVLYVLRREEDGKIIFREYDEANKLFTAPRTIVQNKVTYYILDAKEDAAVSKRYTRKDLSVKDFEVKGYVTDDQPDFCYLRAMNGGEEGIYSFDLKEETLQRFPAFENAGAEDAQAKELEKAKTANQKLAKTANLLKILLIAAVVILVALAAVMAAKILGGKKKTKPTLKDLYPDEEIPEEAEETQAEKTPEEEYPVLQKFDLSEILRANQDATPEEPSNETQDPDNP